MSGPYFSEVTHGVSVAQDKLERHSTDVLRVQKAASPAAFPQKLLLRNGESSKPQLPLENKGDICVLDYVCINDYIV